MKYQKEQEFMEANVFGKGNPNEEYARFFIGNSYLNPLALAGEPQVFVSAALYPI